MEVFVIFCGLMVGSYLFKKLGGNKKKWGIWLIPAEVDADGWVCAWYDYGVLLP